MWSAFVPLCQCHLPWKVVLLSTCNSYFSSLTYPVSQSLSEFSGRAHALLAGRGTLCNRSHFGHWKLYLSHLTITEDVLSWNNHRLTLSTQIVSWPVTGSARRAANRNQTLAYFIQQVTLPALTKLCWSCTYRGSHLQACLQYQHGSSQSYHRNVTSGFKL